jgi:hypothetical protein
MLSNSSLFMRLSPSPYGVFGLVLDGRLLSYYYQLEKDLVPLLGPAQPGTNPAGRGPGAETPTGRAAP